MLSTALFLTLLKLIWFKTKGAFEFGTKEKASFLSVLLKQFGGIAFDDLLCF